MRTVADKTDIVQEMQVRGFCLIAPAQLNTVTGTAPAALHSLCPSWDALPRDAYLRDGGRYRSRRHASYVQEIAADTLSDVPHRAHWQPVDYNALHGGIERWFEPVTPDVAGNATWRDFILRIGALCAGTLAAPPDRWYIEAHQFRIDTAEGIGRPTPEGAHRDGVDFVAVVLVNRRGVKGGESRVFDAHGPNGVRFTLTEPWSVLLLDDARVIHETTPIQPDGEAGVRDTLVITYRRGGFQDPV